MIFKYRVRDRSTFLISLALNKKATVASGVRVILAL